MFVNAILAYRDDRCKEKDKNKLNIFSNTKLISNSEGIVKTKINSLRIDNNLAEHFDMAYKINKRPINDMKETYFDEDKIVKQINKSKNNKALGPDGIKNEIYN